LTDSGDEITPEESENQGDEVESEDLSESNPEVVEE